MIAVDSRGLPPAAAARIAPSGVCRSGAVGPHHVVLFEAGNQTVSRRREEARVLMPSPIYPIRSEELSTAKGTIRAGRAAAGPR